MSSLNLKTICILVYVIILVVNAAPSSKLPDGFIQCKKSDPELDECLKNGFRKGLPHLVNGVPSLGLIKIDPLRIIKLKIDQGTGPVSINMTFNDLDISNLKSTEISKLHYDTANYNLQYEAKANSLMLDGNYEVVGKVLILPIVGKGKCKFSLEYSDAFANIQMKPVVRNGIKYVDIEKVSWSFTPTQMHIQLDNLFNGDKALGNHMNVFLNENWRDLLIELQPAIEKVFGTAFTEIGQQFLKRIPMDQLLLN